MTDVNGGDSGFPDGAVDVETLADGPVQFSVCTLVSNVDLYRDTIASFRAVGFGGAATEFLYVDNTRGNTHDAYAGLNRLISRASGRYVILCHQDLILLDDKERLTERLDELTVADPIWAVAGNAGTSPKRKGGVHITDLAGMDRSEGTLPMRAASLDENLIIVRRDSNIGFSSDLSGFHLYGTDIVAQAELAGRTAYVIDFHVEHRGLAATGSSFASSADEFEKKYERALEPRRIRTTVFDTHVGKLDFMDAISLRMRIRRRRRRAANYGMRHVGLKRARFRLHELLNGPNYTIDGERYRIPADTPLVAKRAIWQGSYEEPERLLAAKYLEKGQTVVELGGSFGIVSRCVRKAIGPEARHIIVEANPALLEYCIENGVPGGKGENTTVLNAAISYGEGDTVTFTVTEGLHDSRLGEPAAAGRIITVPATTLSRLLAEQKVGGPYALVCDIEGTEFDILQFDREALADCTCIIAELHPRFFYEAGRTVHQLMANLAEAGFSVTETMANVIVALKRKD